MAPQQIQALEILLATVPELEQKISKELEDNPTLELVEVATHALAGNPVGAQPDGETAQNEAAEAAANDEALATLIQLNENWRDYAPPAQPLGGRVTDEDIERRQYLFDSLTTEPTLQEVLLAQLREIEGLDEDLFDLCTEVIGSIDEKGYLSTHPKDIAIVKQVDLDEAEKAVMMVQSFEPAGICARDLRECLLLQLDRRGDVTGPLHDLVADHLEALGRNQVPQVARKMGIETDEVYELMRRLRQLVPHPGTLISGDTPDYVCPEVYVEWNEELADWAVRPNREYAPKLRISPHYLKMLDDPNVPKEAKSYIREKIANSKLLLHAIDQRQSTIERIAHALVKYQRSFFDEGAESMRPLTMGQVGDEIGVHETTISRAISGKYMQTPHGLIPFRRFFAAGYQGADGEEVSSLSIKTKLQSLVDAEDSRKPLSDQKLATLLKEQGFDVARRTVAKYREELGILSSSLRRSY